MSLESQIREKEAEIVLLRQELSKERLFNEEKVDELKTKMIKIEQEYQNKLLEMSRGGKNFIPPRNITFFVRREKKIINSSK